MKRYYQYKVKLKIGTEFLAKVDADKITAFNIWANGDQTISKVEEVGSVNKIGPHSSQKTKIALARMAAGITQQEMCDKLGVSMTSYQRWEYGQFKPKTQMMIAIGEILGVDWTTLVE